MHRYEEHCVLFGECYPQFRMKPETFEQLMLKEDTSVTEHRESGRLLGFDICEKNAVRLLCVSPQERHRGIGTALLSKAEAGIRKAGYDEILIGGVSSRFLIGADSSSWGFFEKAGYTEVGRCDELLMPLKDFSFAPDDFRGHRIAEYGFYNGSIDALRRAVAEVNEDWVQYFNENDRVYCAKVGGGIVSFCLVSTDVKNYLSDAFGRVGMPGCVGTVPGFRNRGIAIEMIARVTEILKNEGQDISFIFFTGVAEWYKKLGYEVFMTEIFAKKEL